MSIVKEEDSTPEDQTQQMGATELSRDLEQNLDSREEPVVDEDNDNQDSPSDIEEGDHLDEDIVDEEIGNASVTDDDPPRNDAVHQMHGSRVRYQPNFRGETIVIGEVIEEPPAAADNATELYEDQEELWHLAQATPVEPELILFAVPADTEGNQWFRDKYVKFGVVGAMCVSIIVILSLAGGMLFMTTMDLQENNKTNEEIVLDLCRANPNCTTATPSPTGSPTQHQSIVLTSDLRDEILSKIRTLSDESSLDMPLSPQNKAFQWLLTQDEINLQHSQEDLLNRYIMSVIYLSLGGSQWFSSENWLTSKHICEWEHIICNNGLPQEISLEEQNLIGTIPSEMTNLGSLERLSFMKNRIKGTIPSSIIKMSKLETFILNENFISGSIPESITNLSLSTISLDSNHMIGTIPQSIGNATRLRTLSLQDNKLTGTIPQSIGDLFSLEYLGLSENLITGSIPISIGRLSKLEQLVIRDNYFSGSIPESISNLENLKALSLQSNHFTGVIPTSFQNLDKLEKLDVTNTDLSGVIPEGMCSMTHEQLFKIRFDCDRVICNCCSLCSEDQK